MKRHNWPNLQKLPAASKLRKIEVRATANRARIKRWTDSSDEEPRERFIKIPSDAHLIDFRPSDAEAVFSNDKQSMRILLSGLLLLCLCSCATRHPEKRFGAKGVKVFTADGDWIAPKGVTVVEVLGRGGSGGGAGGGSGYFVSGSGGGGASSSAKFVSVMPGTTYHITIGAAGHGGHGDNAGSGAPGENGGTSSFGSLASFPGAGGGRPGTENKPPGGQGAGGGGDGGVMGFPGESSSTASGGDPSGGGGAGDGNGGNGSTGSDHNGHDGVNGGGGGGGGRQVLEGNNIGPAGHGGNGTLGRIEVRW